MLDRLKVGAAALLAGAVAAVAIPLPVSSYNIFGPNCRFDPNNDYDGLGIGVHTGDPEYDASIVPGVENGAWAWNQSMTPQFTMVAYGSSTRDVRMEFANLGASVGGRLTYWCGSGHYSQDPRFEFGTNATYYLGNLTNRTRISIHELGHAYGVAHSSTSGCDIWTAGLMHPDAVWKGSDCSWANPTFDDYFGAVDAHNG